MNLQVAARLAPWSGVVFVVLAVLSIASLPSDFLDDPETIASDFADEQGRILTAVQAAAVAAAALLWFSGTLASALVANGAGERIAGIARSGGTAAAGLLLAAAVTIGAGALRADEDGEIAPASAAVLLDVGILLGAAAMPVAAAVLVAATALGSLYGNRFLPFGLDWVSLVLAIALLILPINFIAVLVFFVWVLLVAALMIAGRLPFESAPTRQPPVGT